MHLTSDDIDKLKKLSSWFHRKSVGVSRASGNKEELEKWNSFYKQSRAVCWKAALFLEQASKDENNDSTQNS